MKYQIQQIIIVFGIVGICLTAICAAIVFFDKIQPQYYTTHQIQEIESRINRIEEKLNERLTQEPKTIQSIP